MLKDRPRSLNRTRRKPKAPARASFGSTVAPWLDLILHGIVASCAVLAFFQYRDSVQNQRVNRTFEFVQGFRNDPHPGAISMLEDLVARIDADLDREGPNISLLGPEEALEVQDKVIRSAIYQPRTLGGKDALVLPPEITLISGFFNELQICVEQRACDRKTAHVFFDDYVADAWEVIGPVASYERTHGRPSFAKAMQRFAESAEKRQ